MLKATQERLARKDPVRLVFYGDSISEVKPGWSGGASSPETNWGAQLVRALSADFPGSVFTGAPFGIGGQNSYEGLGRLDGLAALAPDLVLIAFGANDCAHHFLLPEETELALVTLATEARRRFGADVILAGAGGDNPRKPFFRHLAETLDAQRRAAERAGVPFVDVRAAVLAATADGERWASFHINEGNCHPTDAGHRVWADAARAVIRRELGADGRAAS